MDAGKAIKVDLIQLHLDPENPRHDPIADEPEIIAKLYVAENVLDHRRLSTVIQGLRRPWMLTYDDVPEIRAMYPRHRTMTKALTYYAQVKRTGVELFVFSDKVQLPAEPAAA
jgi:hypothetical protein